MDFSFNSEQRDFRAALRQLVDKEIIPVANEWERTGRYPTEIVDRLREIAGRLLRQSPEYQSVVRELGGTPVK